MLADSGNNGRDVKFGMGDREKRSPLIWEKSGTASQGRQHLNKVFPGLRGSDSGAEEEWVRVEGRREFQGGRGCGKGQRCEGPWGRVSRLCVLTED